MFGFVTVVWRLAPSVHDSEGVPNAIEQIYSVSDPPLTFDNTVTVKENNAMFLFIILHNIFKLNVNLDLM